MPLAWVRNEKPDLYAVATCIKVRPYLAAIPDGGKGHFRSFGEVSGLRTGGGNFRSRGYDYFFFFEVFFATFLVAAFELFFAFIAFLAMWSSVKNWLSEQAHAVNRYARH